jgi:hypothetical protein
MVSRSDLKKGMRILEENVHTMSTVSVVPLVDALLRNLLVSSRGSLVS